MGIEIVEPEGNGIVLQKRDTRVLVWCDCSASDGCPQGKCGSQTRCRVWMEKKHLSAEAIDYTKAMNRFTR
jgi:hypothetical protein